MLEKLETMSLLDHGEVTGYKNSFQQIKEYLKGNYKLHVKPQSYYSDHCLAWGLSQANNPYLVAPHSHAHQKRCPHCKGMDEIIEKLKEKLNEFKTAAKGSNVKQLAEFVVEYDSNVEKLYDLKSHNARSVFTSLERERIIASLEDNQCFCTLDYAQKWLPAFYRESQKMYFGKCGLSWHISHCLCKIAGKHVQHSFVHLLNEQDQDSTAVVEIIRHFTTELKIVGVTALHVRTDNAAYYHSSATIASIPDISRSTGVTVLSWSFSEAQSGKSSSDRVAALVKRKMRNYIDKEHNVDTVDRMFEAIHADRQLRGVSVYVGTVKLISKSPAKIAKISEYGHFQYNDKFTTAWRFYGIGQGVKLSDLKPINATFAETKRGGKLASAVVNVSDRKNLEEGTATEFWFFPPLPKDPRHAHHHEPNDEDDEEVSGKPSFHNPAAAHHQSLYYCKDCSASFIKHFNLLHHQNSDKKCKRRPDKISLYDKALNMFKRTLENVQQDLTLSPLNEAIQKIRSGTEPALPMGWAIRTGKKGGRLPEKAKEFITKLFNDRWKLHIKLREEEAWNNMKAEASIAPEERMTREQIRNLINTLVQKAKLMKTSKTRGMRAITQKDDEIEDEDEGVYYEEIEVSEEDIVLTDDDIHFNILHELDYHFDDIHNPIFGLADIGDINFE